MTTISIFLVFQAVKERQMPSKFCGKGRGTCQLDIELDIHVAYLKVVQRVTINVVPWSAYRFDKEQRRKR